MGVITGHKDMSYYRHKKDRISNLEYLVCGVKKGKKYNIDK